MTVASDITVKTSAGASLRMPLVVGSGATAVTLPNRVFLAPMSGVSDLPFRRIAERFGAGLVVSEMVASRELTFGHEESVLRLAGQGLRVHAVQLAGRAPEWMAEAAKLAERAGAQLIDINMGCPAKKVVGGASGSALMRDLDLAARIIEATVDAVAVPVTVKMRLGWDDATLNAPELARLAEAAGAQMLTVHGRTRCQFYEGNADWSAVAAVREASSLPLVVNGDIETVADCEDALSRSGADAVMIGRASYGRPWWPGALAGMPTTRIDEAAVATEHFEAMLAHYGKRAGIRKARKHVAAYLERADAPVAMRREAITTEQPAIVLSALANTRSGRSERSGATDTLADAA